MKPQWNKTLADVLMRPTERIKKMSPRTGNEYETDVIPGLTVLATGSRLDLEDGYRYSIVDKNKDAGITLEYEIKAPEAIEVEFGMWLHFANVQGGATTSGGWYKADSIRQVQQKQAPAAQRE